MVLCFRPLFALGGVQCAQTERGEVAAVRTGRLLGFRIETRRKIVNELFQHIGASRSFERRKQKPIFVRLAHLFVNRSESLAAFVRSIVGLEQSAVNEKFGKHLNTSALNLEQQEFLKTIIDYVRENGAITKEELLSASPFDAYDIIDLFSDGIGPIDDVVSTLGSVIETPPGFFDYSDIPARACARDRSARPGHPGVCRSPP